MRAYKARPPKRDIGAAIPLLRYKIILIVEDETFLRETFGNYFENHGFQAYEAESGKSALNILSEHEVDVILLVFDKIFYADIKNFSPSFKC